MDYECKRDRRKRHEKRSPALIEDVGSLLSSNTRSKRIRRMGLEIICDGGCLRQIEGEDSRCGSAQFVRSSSGGWLGEVDTLCFGTMVRLRQASVCKGMDFFYPDILFGLCFFCLVSR